MSPGGLCAGQQPVTKGVKSYPARHEKHIIGKAAIKCRRRHRPLADENRCRLRAPDWQKLPPSIGNNQNTAWAAALRIEKSKMRQINLARPGTGKCYIQWPSTALKHSLLCRTRNSKPNDK